jgi:hypothetical protein
MTTPLEVALAQLEAAQAEVQRLSHELHRLGNERAVGLSAGDVEEANRLNDLIAETNTAYRLAGGIGGGALADAQAAVEKERRELTRRRQHVVELERRAKHVSTELGKLMQRSGDLALELAQIETELADERAALASLEPAEQRAQESVKPQLALGN